LDRRFELLAGGPRTVPARHATMRASMDWSFELLDDDEKALLADLGVFAGRFDVDAVKAVHPAATFEQLAVLVDRSLVAVDATFGENRYRLLETVRAYAVDQLRAANEHAAACGRHRGHYLATAEAAEPLISGPHQQEWLERLGLDHDNVVAALASCRDEGAAEELARLAVAMTPYWLERSQWSECRLWLDAAVSGKGSPRDCGRRCSSACAIWRPGWVGST